ncbi:MAG: pseudouridine synthase [Lachnospiraceae bacterium]|nr:pseudouridine synthase [Lachnospiraceae bacterium]
MRINKFLSEAGICSRRRADEEIAAGNVRINGQRAGLGDTVFETDVVEYKGEVISVKTEKKVYLYYKPAGVVCTEEKREKNNLFRAILLQERVTYLGRLDKNSEGLLLLSNDGALNQQLMRPGAYHEKEYEVQIDRPVTAELIRKLSEGVYLSELDRTTRPCKVRKIKSDTFSIILTQGLNRQIRRMCQELGCRVKRLVRVRICNLTLEGMKAGEVRELTKEEERILRTMASEKTTAT